MYIYTCRLGVGACLCSVKLEYISARGKKEDLGLLVAWLGVHTHTETHMKVGIVCVFSFFSLLREDVRSCLT